MSNEEKILEKLTAIQNDIDSMKADIAELKQKKSAEVEEENLSKEERIKKQLEVLEGIQNLFTEEEVEKLAAAVGE